MPIARLKLGGKRFVVIPIDEHRQLKAKATRKTKASKPKRRLTRQDRGDIAESLRRLAEPGYVTADELARKLGWNRSRSQRRSKPKTVSS